MQVIKKNVFIYIENYTDEKEGVIIDNFELISIEGSTAYYKFKLNNEIIILSRGVKTCLIKRTTTWILYRKI